MDSRSSPIEYQRMLLAIPGYSELGLMHPASPSILIETLYFRRHQWRVKVSPCGFDKGVPDYVAVLVSVDMPITHHPAPSVQDTSICIEILDKTWEHTVFCKEEILGDANCLSLVVRRSDLEAASCVHNDNIPLRCTLTRVVVDDMKKKQLPPWANWWCRFRRAARSKWCVVAPA